MNKSTEIFLEARDPNIDESSLMQMVESRLVERRSSLGLDNSQFPIYGSPATGCPDKPQDITYNPNLYHHLRIANKLSVHDTSETILTASKISGVPLVGRFWSIIREQAHNLVRFYIFKASSQQAEVNEQLVTCLNLLTVENQEQKRKILSLEADLNLMQKHIKMNSD